MFLEKCASELASSVELYPQNFLGECEVVLIATVYEVQIFSSLNLGARTL